jgi:hypothetical protein
MADSANGKAKDSRPKTSRAKHRVDPRATPTPGGPGAAERPGEAEAKTKGETHAALGCPVAFCPICLAISAVQPLRPDVVEHLLKAGSEFFLAVRAVIDARGDGVDPDAGEPSTTHLEKIDIG